MVRSLEICSKVVDSYFRKVCSVPSPYGRKDLVALADGYWESTESWAELLRDLKKRGMKAPDLSSGHSPVIPNPPLFAVNCSQKLQSNRLAGLSKKSPISS